MLQEYTPISYTSLIWQYAQTASVVRSLTGQILVSAHLRARQGMPAS